MLFTNNFSSQWNASLIRLDLLPLNYVINHDYFSLDKFELPQEEAEDGCQGGNYRVSCL